MSSPLGDAFRELRDPARAARSRQFPVPTRNLVVLAKQRQRVRDRASFGSLVKPENADEILDLLPAEEGDRLHVVTCGDFVYCDLFTRWLDRMGPPVSMTISTLSLSEKNAHAIREMMTRHAGFPFHLILSAYFQSSNAAIFTAVEALITEAFPERFTLSVGRSHTKVAIVDYGADRGTWVIEGSLNLRSSNNLEQFTVFRDRQLAEFHQRWIDQFRAAVLAEQPTQK